MNVAVPGKRGDVQAQPERVGRTSWKEYGVRFVFGGVITAVVGIVGTMFGPSIAGLFLAFPAILPASLTLIENHDGKSAAGNDALGAAAGAAGLLLFGLVVWLVALHAPAALVLAGAFALWFVAGVGVWWFFRRLHLTGESG